MKILLMMDPGIPVPPQFYGGHERLVYLFAEEYQRMGHEVTLLAGPDSHCSGKTVTFGVNNLKRAKFQKIKEALFVWQYLLKNHRKFDIVHNFGRLLYLIPILNRGVTKIMTYGRRVTPSGIKTINNLPNKNLTFTACSNSCVRTGNVAGKWVTVYNTIDFSAYHLNTNVVEQAPLIFLGRLDRIKGVHLAIQAAKATNNKLIIAGNISHVRDNYAYFKTEIEPYIDDDQIKYVGELNDTDKNTYLGQAKALLFPIQWDEPFGMVMVEAMACGTPVIAINRGSVPEIIKDGINGYKVDDLQGIITAINKIGVINRAACHKEAYDNYNVHLIANNYLNLFKP